MKSRQAETKPRAYNQTARAQASEATWQRIIDAFLARLMTQWYDEITLDRVAEDASVTVQTIVRRFGGKEGLLTEAVKTFAGEVNAARSVVPGDIASVVDALFVDYERTGDTVIRLLALEPRHEALQRVLSYGRQEHRDWVAGAFADYLARFNTAGRERVLDELVVVTDVYTWKLLRRDMGKSVNSAKAVVRQLISAIQGE